MTHAPARPLLSISESAQTVMIDAAERAHPQETGGVLIGVHVDGQPWVTAAVELITDDRGRHHYRLPGGATQAAVHLKRASDSRLGYLGDWHSHPSDVGPSTKDLATLTIYSIRHPRTPNPTLIVVRRGTDGYYLDARRITAITPRTCDVRMTGNLPARQGPIDEAPPSTPSTDEPGSNS